MDSSRSLISGNIWIPAVLLILAAVEVFHPHPHDLFALDVDRWLWVHYAQLTLFPLSALAVTALVKSQRGAAAAVGRAAMFVFAATYIAFDTAAGIVTGILVAGGRRSGSPGAWRAPVDAVWEHPIVGGSPQAAALLAVLGAVALSVGTVAIAFALKRAGHGWIPSLLLGVSGFGISVFRTHAWPGGPLAFGGMGVAAAWLLWEGRGKANSGG
jgi:hypothetical protein